MLVVEEPEQGSTAYCGQLDSTILERTFDSEDRSQWIYYVCGSQGMVEAVVKTLRRMGIPDKQILYEQLAF